MKCIFSILISLCMLLAIDSALGAGGAGAVGTQALTQQEETMLAHAWELEKYLRDIYLTGSECSDNPYVAQAAVVHQDNMDVLRGLLDDYGLAIPVPDEGVGVFTDSFLGLLMRSEFLWTGIGYVCIFPFDPDLNAYSIYLNAMVYEDFAIWRLLQAIELPVQQPLFDVFNEMLADASAQLRLFASLHPNGWEGLFLEPELVEAILAGAFPAPGDADFVINPGLNDAWYEPETNGQGFFLTVYPDRDTVFLGWFTYDMEFPGQEAIAGLGDACQRWLTAQGPYDGARADLVVYNARGGLFDQALPAPELEAIGSIVLQFESCEHGFVSYDLPDVGLSGTVPIQRLAPDNVAACEVQAGILE